MDASISLKMFVSVYWKSMVFNMDIFVACNLLVMCECIKNLVLTSPEMKVVEYILDIN